MLKQPDKYFSLQYETVKGPGHLQKNLFKKNHKSYAMPEKISKTSFGRLLLRLKILQVPSKVEMRSCF